MMGASTLASFFSFSFFFLGLKVVVHTFRRRKCSWLTHLCTLSDNKAFIWIGFWVPFVLTKPHMED